MATEENAKLIEVFTVALALPPEERAAYLAEVCGDDEWLHREVESLLAHAKPEYSKLDVPVVERLAKEILGWGELDLIGQQVQHYLIREEIGRGGMGQVFKAYDQKLQREVAIKFLPPDYLADMGRVRRFEQEARAASALSHPNIITIHDIEEHDGLHFIVMEYVAGQTLRTRLQAGKLSPEEAVDIAIQVAEALAAAHHAGIVHRDIKPENIMLRADGQVKVLDFGIAKLTETRNAERGTRYEEAGRSRQAERGARNDDAETLLQAAPNIHTSSFSDHTSTMLGSVMGTVNYMSPEQARGEILNGQSDVFSLGQILLEMVTGRNLFADVPPIEVLQRLRSEQEPFAVDEDLVGGAKAFAEVIRKALKRDLRTRYVTAKEMLLDLKQIQRRAATKWLRRSVAGGLGGIVLLLFALALVAWFSIHETWQEQILSDGHRATVMQAAFAPDGKRLVSVSRDHRVIVWDFARREQIKELLPHQEAVNSVAFSPDGKWFATGSSDKTVIVWKAETLELVQTMQEHRDKVMAVAFSPDGKWLASASGSDTGTSTDYRTVLWEVNGWQKVREFADGRSYGNLLFSPDSRFLKTQGEQWEIATGQRHTNEQDHLGWNWNVLVPGANQLLGVAASGVEFHQLTPNGQLHGSYKIGNFTNDQSPHQDYVRAAACSSDGKLCATAADNIVLWDATSRNIQARFVFGSSVWSVTFSPDNRWLVSTHGDGSMLVWNLALRRLEGSFNTHAEAVRAVAYSPDGKRFATAGDDRSVIVWNAATGAKVAVLTQHTTRVINLVFSADGQGLVSLDQRGRLIRWELATQRVVWDVEASQGSSCLALSPDGQWLVTRHVVIDYTNGQRLFGLGKPDNDLTFLGAGTFSSDGKLLAGVDGNQLFLMDLSTRRILERQTKGNAPMLRVRFSPNNKTIATGSTDGLVQLWATNPLRPLGLAGQHEGQVSSVDFSPDGKYLASVGADKTVKIWDVRERKFLQEVGTHAAPVAAVAFSPSGDQLLTGEQDRTVRVYTRHRSLWGKESKWLEWFY